MGRRNTETPRKWKIQTDNTYMLHARIPKDLMVDLRKYVEARGETITESVIRMIREEVRSDE